MNHAKVHDDHLIKNRELRNHKSSQGMGETQDIGRNKDNDHC